MVERDARDQLSGLLERLLEGEIRPVEFDDEVSRGRFSGSDDPAVRAAYRVFNEIGDQTENRHDDAGRRESLAGPIRRKARRFAAFLSTNLEYSWPDIIFPQTSDYTGICLLLSFALTFGSAIATPIGRGYVPLVVLGCGVAATLAVRHSLPVREQRHLAAQVRKHRSDARAIEAWPFQSDRDFPPGAVGIVCIDDDPLRAAESVRSMESQY